MTRISLPIDYVQEYTGRLPKRTLAEICTNCGAPTEGNGLWISGAVRTSYETRSKTFYTYIPFCKSCSIVKKSWDTSIFMFLVATFIIGLVFMSIISFLYNKLSILFMGSPSEMSDWFFWIFIVLSMLLSGIGLYRKFPNLLMPARDDPIRSRMYDLEKYIKLQVSASNVKKGVLSDKFGASFYLDVDHPEWVKQINSSYLASLKTQ